MKKNSIYITDINGNDYLIEDIRSTISQTEILIELDNRMRGLTILERQYWEDILRKLKSVNNPDK
ncbi:MAG: hypothetical protein JWN76_1275 [Chitinophagaceae bacterium]|nr:hypothetical protein [Chitinophagaceae bacterium]